MSLEILTIAMTALLMAVLAFFRMKVCYYPAAFFIIKFLAARLIDFDRVRNNVAFQLAVLAVVFFVVVIKNSGKVLIGDKVFYKSIAWILMFVLFNIIMGVIDGHKKFQILIDSYKYIEIIVYYFLFRICWPDNQKLIEGVKAIGVVMLTIGTLEIALTARGGVGLNLIMGFFPIVFLLSLFGYIKNYKFIMILSMAIVVTSQTRTYIIAFALGLVLLLYLMPKSMRHKMCSGLFAVGAIAIVGVCVFGGELLNTVLSRFSELSQGFAQSGGYRIDEYIVALEKFAEHPLLGNGFGYLQYTYINKMGWINWGDFIHCVYIEILFKTGITGTVWIFMVIGTFIARIAAQMREFKNKNNFMFAICCGGICSFAVWALTYMFAPLTTYGSVFMGALTASIAISNYYKENKIESVDYIEGDS